MYRKIYSSFLHNTMKNMWQGILNVNLSWSSKWGMEGKEAGQYRVSAPPPHQTLEACSSSSHLVDFAALCVLMCAYLRDNLQLDSPLMEETVVWHKKWVLFLPKASCCITPFSHLEDLTWLAHVHTPMACEKRPNGDNKYLNKQCFLC